jgi:alpha-tubulin suppressor-like RCC1 family protein
VTKPHAVGGLAKVAAVAAGYGHTCARLTSGKVACWGYNAYGQIGNGKIGKDYGSNAAAKETTPVLVPQLNDATRIWAGGFNTCVRRKSGQTWCWGLNNYGQLGTGSTGGDKGSYQSKPKHATQLSDASLIQGQIWHACGLLKGGALGCWGTAFHGALGNGESGALKSYGKPVKPKVPGPVRDLSGGALSLTSGSTAHSCALNDAGEVWCWGRNDFGQLGAKQAGHSALPVKVL